MTNRIADFSWDGFTLKIIAITAMALDHIGAVFFPHILSLRLIGRISAPIMAFFISEGYTKTRNIRRYMLRLFVFALLSMVPYYLVFGRSPFNILFDLLLGLIIIFLTDRVKEDYCKWGIVLLGTIIAFLLGTDGRMGISALVYLFYRFKNDIKALVLSMSILYVCPMVLMVLYSAVNLNALPQSIGFWLHPFSLLSLPLIWGYNGERGRKVKYLFYIFYPAHLVILYGIMNVIR